MSHIICIMKDAMNAVKNRKTILGTVCLLWLLTLSYYVVRMMTPLLQSALLDGAVGVLNNTNSNLLLIIGFIGLFISEGILALYSSKWGILFEKASNEIHIGIQSKIFDKLCKVPYSVFNSPQIYEKIELVFVPGGKTRQESVLFALEKIASLGSVDMVLIHDGARPFVSKEIVKAVFEKVKNCGAACCGVSPVDTQKEVDSQGNITKHLQRSSMVAVQTPQGFLFQSLLEAHRKAAIQNIQCTDDTEIWSKFCDTSVQVVKGSPENIKITFPGDLIKMNQTQLGIKIGLGYDLHRLVEDRPLMLGGVKIPSPKGETGHSDGDVLCHAITDSLLGAAGLGDIGEMFPPSDEKWKDADSKDLLKQAWKRVKKEGWGLINLDCVIKLEKPKILPFRKEIISTLATVLEVDTEKIFLKAKTGEGQDSVGNGESVEAWATCLLTK